MIVVAVDMFFGEGGGQSVILHYAPSIPLCHISNLLPLRPIVRFGA